MPFKKEIEQSLEQIRILEEHFRHARNSEILPLSFFSASYDIVRELAETLHCIEQEQLKFMQEQFIANEISFLETSGSISKTKEIKEVKEEVVVVKEEVVVVKEEVVEVKEEAKEEVKEIPVETKILADTRKYMSLNDKFRFQREIFLGSTEEMNKFFDILNEFSTINDTWSFMESQPWYDDSEIVAEFKELIGKRFS